MLTNPVVTTPAAQTDSDRPPLRIAARAMQLAPEAQPTTAAVITQEVGGWHTQWRRTLETVKTALAGLEQACESAIDARQAEAAGLIEALVQSAEAETRGVAAQAQIEINELQQRLVTLQTSVETLQASVEAEREHVTRISAQLELETSARVRAETERDELQRDCGRRVAAAEAQAEALRADIEVQKAELTLTRQQLEVAVAERSKLTATFRLVQRALALSTPEKVPDAVDAIGGAATVGPEGAAHPRPAEHLAAPEAPAEAPNAVDDAPSTLIEAPPKAVEDVRRVLEQVEAMYLEDLESGQSGIEIADRLTASLRHARSIIVARWSLDDLDAQKLFEHHMGLLLDTHAGTSFGRHLGIAAYASRTSDLSVPHEGSGPV